MSASLSSGALCARFTVARNMNSVIRVIACMVQYSVDLWSASRMGIQYAEKLLT